jgi:hypothetical protein
MAYGKTDKDTVRRSVFAGSVSLTRYLTKGKENNLSQLRENYIKSANILAQALFEPDPILNQRTPQELEAAALAAQKQITGFNTAYIEKARLQVKPAITMVEDIYISRVVGRIMHCATRREYSAKVIAKAAKSKKVLRQWCNIPEATQVLLTDAAVADAEKIFQKLSRAKIIALVQQVVNKNCKCALLPQIPIIIKAIHAECLERYQIPQFGKDDNFVCQLNLDYRVALDLKTKLIELDDLAQLLVDPNNKAFNVFVSLANPTPRGERIKIPLTLSRKQFRLLVKEETKTEQQRTHIKSLAVLLSKDKLTARVIIGKQREISPIETVTHILGRDFGYNKTVALTLIKLNQPLCLEDVERLSHLTKKEAKKYLTTHIQGDEQVVLQKSMDGRNFLKAINTHATVIDSLRSEIDSSYNKLHEYRTIIGNYLGLNKEDLITEAMVTRDAFVITLCKRFFLILKRIERLKKQRTERYRKIATIKRNWLGHTANIEAKIAKDYNALVVSENLTIVTKEKTAPDYKGRTFNKMLNNGSKGIYKRMANEKHEWSGTPTVAVNAAYTSTTCTHHAIVDSKMRNGETFICSICGIKLDADDHASETIARYLLLNKMPNLT